MSLRFYNVIFPVVLLALASSAPAQENDNAMRIPLDIIVVETGNPSARSLVIREVTERRIGYRMGLVPGDVILSVNGHKVHSIQRLRELLHTRAASVVWKGKDGTYYRNTVRIAESTLPGAPPTLDINGFTQGKSQKEVEEGIDKEMGVF